jgi:hypothetical protein
VSFDLLFDSSFITDNSADHKHIRRAHVKGKPRMLTIDDLLGFTSWLGVNLR